VKSSGTATIAVLSCKVTGRLAESQAFWLAGRASIIAGQRLSRSGESVIALLLALPSRRVWITLHLINRSGCGGLPPVRSVHIFVHRLCTLRNRTILPERW
jgi:hypothetical protein